MPRTRFDREGVPSAELVAHFWSKVDRDGPVPEHAPELGPCWIWTDYRKANGYGQFYVDRKPVYAHRFAYEQTYGLLGGRKARHRCDNGQGGCVRPDHMQPGTQADNVRDCVERGRTARGERNGQAKLTDAQVAALREWRKLRGDLIPGERALIGAALGISKTHLGDILRGRKRPA